MRVSLFRNILWTASLVSLLTILSGPAPVWAGVARHTVQPGESLSAITRDFYGDKDLFAVIALYNGIDDPERIKPGTVIRLPFSERVTVGRGESLSLIAKRVWNTPMFYQVLADVNGIARPESVPAGTKIRIPVMVPYRLGRGESLSTVAGSYYGNPKQFRPIALASAIDDPARIAAGTRIKIPLILTRAARPRPRPAPAPPKPATPAPVKKPPPPAPASRKPDRTLIQAEEAFRRGDYGEARDLLAEGQRSISSADRPEALRLLASCHLAYGDRDSALAALRESYGLDPSFRPQPSMVNPELMKLHEQAMGRR